jgi:very-short-patch-repair endonuclease
MSKFRILKQALNPAVLQRAKELRQEMTPAEQHLWAELRTNRLSGFHFRRQQIIGNSIVDFYCRTANLAVEVDGGIHLSQMAADAERDQRLAELGIKVLRFRNEQVETDLASVLGAILKECRLRGI